MNGYTVMRTDNLSICHDCAFNIGLWCQRKSRATNAVSCDQYEHLTYVPATSGSAPVRKWQT